MNWSWAKASPTLSVRVLPAVLAVVCIVAGMVIGLVFFSTVVTFPDREPSWHNLPPFNVLLIELIAVGACLLWVPIGSFISARFARAWGKPALHFVVTGASYSALFFLPWLYWVMRMHSRTVWKPAIWIAYFLVFAGWLLGPIPMTIVLAGLSYGASEGKFFALLFAGGFLAMGIAWCSSLFMLILRVYQSSGRSTSTVSSKPQDSPIDKVYLAPFALFLASLCLLLALVLVVATSPISS